MGPTGQYEEEYAYSSGESSSEEGDEEEGLEDPEIDLESALELNAETDLAATDATGEGVGRRL